VLAADDTGFEKNGSCPAGVQRRYAGTAGKITGYPVGRTACRHRRRTFQRVRHTATDVAWCKEAPGPRRSFPITVDRSGQPPPPIMVRFSP
jgi:SRSO17 transposase